MSQQQTLADFGFQRVVAQNKVPSAFAFLEGKANPVNMVRNGQTFFIDADDESKPGDPSRDVTFTYSKSVAERTLVVFAAFLQDSDTNVRYTDMRAWQIIVDAWLTAGINQPAGRPEGLQYLAFHSVSEPQSSTAMTKETERQWSSGAVQRSDPPESVEHTPASENWVTNPWIRCAQRVAEGLSTSDLRITASRAWSILVDEDGDDKEYHLVVELASTPVEA